jgi:hypothetical protein
MVNHEGKANRRFPRRVQVQSALDQAPLLQLRTSETATSTEAMFGLSVASGAHAWIDNTSRFVWIYPLYV